MRQLFILSVVLCLFGKVPDTQSHAQGSVLLFNRMTSAVSNGGPTVNRIKSSTMIQAAVPVNDSDLITALGALVLTNDSAAAIWSRSKSMFLSASSPAASITNTDISNWNDAYDKVYTNGWGINKSTAGDITTFSFDSSSLDSIMIADALGYPPYNPIRNANHYPSATGTSGDYIAGNGSIVPFPSIPAAQVQSNWSTTNTTSAAYILNKPVLATVAITGAYGDLSGTPPLITNNNQLTNGAGYTTNLGTVTSVQAGAGLSGTVTTSGTISMPNVGTASTYGSATQVPQFTTDAYGRVSGVSLVTITPAFSSITSTPTSLAGYGIMDAYPLSGNPSNFITISALSTYITSATAASTYTPLSRNLTINGITQSLAVDRTYSLTTSIIPEVTNLYYTDGRARGAFSAGAGIAISGGGVISATVITPTFNPTPGRVLSTTGSNNTFTISTTRNARVTYTVNIGVALTLLPPLTSNAVISLDYSLDNGSTWITVCRATQSYGVAVTLTTASDYVLSGDIPANALVRIYRSATTGATVSIISNAQQEVTY